MLTKAENEITTKPKYILNPPSKTVFYVDYWDIEALLDEVFKNENHSYGFELPPIEKKGNDEDWELSIKKEELGDWDKKP